MLALGWRKKGVRASCQEHVTCMSCWPLAGGRKESEHHVKSTLPVCPAGPWLEEERSQSIMSRARYLYVLLALGWRKKGVRASCQEHVTCISCWLLVGGRKESEHHVKSTLPVCPAGPWLEEERSQSIMSRARYLYVLLALGWRKKGVRASCQEHVTCMSCWPLVGGRKESEHHVKSTLPVCPVGPWLEEERSQSIMSRARYLYILLALGWRKKGVRASCQEHVTCMSCWPLAGGRKESEHHVKSTLPVCPAGPWLEEERSQSIMSRARYLYVLLALGWRKKGVRASCQEHVTCMSCWPLAGGRKESEHHVKSTLPVCPAGPWLEEERSQSIMSRARYLYVLLALGWRKKGVRASCQEHVTCMSLQLLHNFFCLQVPDVYHIVF